MRKSRAMATGAALLTTAGGLGGLSTPAQAAPSPVDRDVDLPLIKVVERNPIVPCRVGKTLLRVRIPARWADDIRKPRVKIRVLREGVVVKSLTSRRTVSGLVLTSCEATWALHGISAEVRWTGRRLPWSQWKHVTIPRRWN